jgi:glycosyltransferase involved in cell wall biosynthesis
MLYVCDFPPANRGGGDTLLYRLLGQYPRNELQLIFSVRHKDVLAATSLADHPHACFPELTGARRHGVRRILVLLDRLFLPILTLWILWRIWRWQPGVLLTVAHGYMFLGAIAAGRICGLPVMLIVHDDWIAMNQDVWVFNHFTRPLFAWSLRKAAHVYAVSPAMADHLRSCYGVEPEVQWPATSENPAALPGERRAGRPLQLVFSGMIYHTVWDSLDLLVRFLRTDPLGKDCELHLFSNYTDRDMAQSGWESANVLRHGWVGESDLKRILAEADVLVLPIGFDSKASYYAATSFPSKVADYLAAARPILVIGPEDSPTVSYLSQNRCAERVCAPSDAVLSNALKHLTESDTRRELGQNAIRLFHRNHNIERQRQVFKCRVQEQLTRNARISSKVEVG